MVSLKFLKVNKIDINFGKNFRFDNNPKNVWKLCLQPKWEQQEVE